jgi:ketosteroid isomerase-like protein
MIDRDAFLGWVETELYEAELAVHNGDAGPRRAVWSRNEPVSVLGAIRNAVGRRELDELFSTLESTFSSCTSYAFELLAYDVVGDMGYTVGFEHTSCSVNGQPRSYTLRATQVYRREDGEWKVAHRQRQPAGGSITISEKRSIALARLGRCSRRRPRSSGSEGERGQRRPQDPSPRRPPHPRNTADQSGRTRQGGE